MHDDFRSIFDNIDFPARGKYLSRVFGIFSEEIVRIWALNQQCPYENLGRPTVKRPGEKKGATLDFSLREKATGKVYASELKCEIEYQSYKYLTLADIAQLDHHTKPAFEVLLELAARNQNFEVSVSRKTIDVDGAILIWGAVTPAGRTVVMESKGFHDVLSMEEIMRDLRSWNCEKFTFLLEERRAWTNEMFESLTTGRGLAPVQAGNK